MRAALVPARRLISVRYPAQYSRLRIAASSEQQTAARSHVVDRGKKCITSAFIDDYLQMFLEE